MATGSKHQLQKVHKHWLTSALPQPCGQTLQRLLTHHYDQSKCTSAVISVLLRFLMTGNKLCSTFLNLDYPINLTNSAINKFLYNIDNIDAAKNISPTIMVPLPFKDRQSANSVKRQMQILSANIGVQIKPVFQTKKIAQVLALKEKKPPIANNQCVATNLNVICATQIMLGTPPDIYTNTSANTNILQSGSILRNMVYQTLIWMTNNSLF